MRNFLKSLKICLYSLSLDEIGRINSNRIAELVHKEYLVFNMQRERTVLHLNVERRDESLSQGLRSRNCGASSKAPVRHIHAVSLVNVFVNVIFSQKSLAAICQREALRIAVTFFDGYLRWLIA